MSLKKPKIAIIDYKMGNMFSVQQACMHAGFDTVVTSDKYALIDCDSLILPGVGAFAQSMKILSDLDLIVPIKEFISSGKLFMGICLGFQLLFSESEEFGVTKGLDIFSGSVSCFPKKENYRVPQIGWNRININEGSIISINDVHPLKGIRDGEFMYFIHSYFVQTDCVNLISSYTSYADIQYCSSICSNNVFATQFHPEKSAKEGLKIYKNWYNKVCNTIWR